MTRQLKVIVKTRLPGGSHNLTQVIGNSLTDPSIIDRGYSMTCTGMMACTDVVKLSTSIGCSGLLTMDDCWGLGVVLLLLLLFGKRRRRRILLSTGDTRVHVESIYIQ